MATCQVKWIMLVADMKCTQLTAPLTRDSFEEKLAPTWCSTRHETDVPATHEVQCRHEGGRVSEWIPACAAHAEYSRTHCSNWTERPITGGDDQTIDPTKGQE